MVWDQIYAQDLWAKELGIQIVHCSASDIKLFLPFIPRNLQAEGGVVHGGIIGSLLHDAALSLVAANVLEADQDALRCLDFQVNYLKAAKDCDLTASACVLRQSRKFVFIQAEVLDTEQQVVAVARMLFAISKADSPAKMITPYAQRDSVVMLTSNPVMDNPMLGMLNTNMQSRRPGFSAASVGKGTCLIQVEDLPVNRNYKGEIAYGAQIFAADSAGVFSSFTSGEPIKRAATVDLKLTFCEPVRNEGLSVLGESLVLNDNLIHHQLSVFGKESLALKAFGTMTLAV